MWIEAPSNLVRIKTPEMDKAVSFTENGYAQVEADTGQYLIETFEAITEK